jgi:hypothetical protein
VFDATFYKETLPERITRDCEGHPGDTPVVNLHLSNGTVLDLCHVVRLADMWLAVAHFRDSKTCADMDIAFVPYELVIMVTVSMYRPEVRAMGFSLKQGSTPQQQRKPRAVR